MADRDSNKINLPTNTTDIRMLACYLQAIAKHGVVSSSVEQSIFADVKINESRKNGLFKDDGDGGQQVSAPARDTHTKSTLKLFGLIDIAADGDSFSVSKLGHELINFYENRTKFSEDDRVALMLKIFLSWNLVDGRYGRDIHPGLIIVKLLCDPELNYYITNHEVTVFTRNSAYLRDDQYDDIKAEILRFRKKDVQVSIDCKKNKTDIFMATFVNNWSFLLKFTENKVLSKKQLDSLLKESSIADSENENPAGVADADAISDNNDSLESWNINRYSLTAPAAYIAYAHFVAKTSSHAIRIDSTSSVNHTDVRDERCKTAVNILRTKPFMLLAGISGTGKSRLVQELAYMSCARNGKLDSLTTEPGNYCLIEVKPNWHDSTELLGYFSNLSGRYELTKFIRFAYKAILNPTVPFFLCLDEMNLAPVEQYFAEYLSVLETRKMVDGTIKSSALIAKDAFANCKLNVEKSVDPTKPIYSVDGNSSIDKLDLYSNEDAEIIKYLKANGLVLPDNLFVIGTVNMDDTTHQFSRKVIDRAFTIEMNGGKLADMFNEADTLVYREESEVVPLDLFKPKYVTAAEALADLSEEDQTTIKEMVPKLLNRVNEILGSTPFAISYRVQNELVIYLCSMLNDSDKDIKTLMPEAFLAVLLQKILPRVQGDDKLLGTDGGSNVLKDLKKFVTDTFGADGGALYNDVVVKLDAMDKRLEASYFTNFFG